MIEPPVPLTFRERSVYLEDAGALVLADVHFGRGAETRVEAPIDRAGDAVGRLERIVAETAPETVVVAGDLFHSFSRISPTAASALAALEQTVEAAGADLRIVAGNHDAMLETHLDRSCPLSVRLDGDVVVTHGHESLATPAALYIVGHTHPAVRIDGKKRPCFLYGPRAYRDTPVLVLPAYSRLARGSSIHRLERTPDRSPLLASPGEFHPGVYDPDSGETLWFPQLSACADLL